MKFVLSLFLSILFVNFSTATDNREAKQQMRFYLQSLFKSTTDTQKDSINYLFINYLRETLSDERTFSLAFDSLPHIGVLMAPNAKFRMFNWNIQYSNGTYKYFGFIQNYNEKGAYVLTELTDRSGEISDPEMAQLAPENWFGALYYEIVLFKDGDSDYYALLGWDGNDDFSKKKIIEIMYFNKNGVPKFGKAVFKMDNKRCKRLIFEYSYLANMMLTYNRNLKMIVFDHLAPPKPSLTGNFKFYGPDFTHDGLEFINGKWVLVSNLDVRNQKIKKEKPKKLSLTF